jgi:hypothetical protein
MARRDDWSSPDPSEPGTIAWMEQELADRWSWAHHVDCGRAWVARVGSSMGTVLWVCWGMLTFALVLAPFPFNLGAWALISGVVVFLWPALLARTGQ